MNNQGAVPLDSDAQLRWQNWQARAAEADRQTMTRMSGLAFVIASVFLVWFGVVAGVI